MHLFKKYLLLVLAILWQYSSEAQEWVSYQSQQEVNDLVDTGDELLMATDAGLVVMNKVSLEKTIFNKANSNLTNNHIQSITRGPNASIWIGTYDARLALFDGSDFQDITMPDVEGFDQYTELYDFKIAPNGDYWLGTSDGVFHRQGQVWYQYDEEELGPFLFKVWDIEFTDEGDVLAASSLIYKYTDGVWSDFTDTSQLIGYLDADMFFSSTGDLFFAGDLNKIGRYDGEEWQEYDNGGLNGSEVIGFTEDASGNIYFNTLRDGIFKLVDDAWVPYMDAQTEAFANRTSYFHIDEADRRWLNHNIYISVSDGGSIRSASISDYTIEYDNIYSLRKGANGKMYFAGSSSTNMVAVLDTEGNWSYFPFPPELDYWSFLGDILVLADNDIWVSSTDGLHHYGGSDWTFYDVESCWSLTVDTEGRLYALSRDRVYIIVDGQFSEYNSDNSPFSADFLSGHGVDADGNLWIAVSEESAIYKVSGDGIWTTYTEDDHPVIRKPSGDFHFDAEGNVWVSDDLIGAVKFDGNNWSNPLFDNRDDIVNADVYSITSDAEGMLYFAHQYGVTTLKDGTWDNLLIEDVPNRRTSISTKIVFDDEGTLWWASRGYGVFAYATGVSTGVYSNYALPAEVSVYPNPASSYVLLDFSVKDAATVSAVIYSNSEQLVTRLDWGRLSVGSYQQFIDLSDLPTGFYAIRLQVGDRFAAKTIVIR